MRWETEQAGRDARAAAQRWRDHRAACVMCSRPPSRRAVCVTGIALEGAKRTAADVLAAHRELDSMPNPDQETLI